MASASTAPAPTKASPSLAMGKERSASKPATKSEGKLRDIQIEVLEDGYTVQCSYDETPSEKHDMPYTRPKKHAMGTAAEVAAFVSEKLGAKAKSA